ncbi:C40 family peptidase [Planobispora rosea]|uniref:C40 family peptidase n=1 Tax=Planobispora rosea TaxID=35762 RepID=UPI00083B7D3C|nr:C40 family peptidase [Planobispora rosea]
MIVEAGAAKAIAIGCGLVSGIALLAGMMGGRHATVSADPAQLAGVVCSYAGRSPAAGESAEPPESRVKTDVSLGGPELGLSAAQLDDLRSGIETAASLGIPKDTVVAGLAASLKSGSSAEDRASPRATALPDDRSRKRAEKIVNATASRLCTELTAEIGQEGELSAEALEALASGSSRGEIALRAALKMIGVPYSWGGGGAGGPSFGIGRGAKTKGFDCSGLTQYAWARAGVALPRVTYAQWNHGSRVSDRIQPGDLVFYDTNPRIPGPDHVGLAASGTQMVNAPHTGAVVRIEPIRRHGFMGAVRPG